MKAYNSNLQICKAKTIETGNWVEGYCIKIQENTYICYADQFDDDLLLSPDNICIPVIPETVSPHSTFSDETGVDLFAGDIIEYNDGFYYFKGIVKFLYGSFGISSYNFPDSIPLELEDSCHCDNFISFWELLLNDEDSVLSFKGEETIKTKSGMIRHIKKIGNVYDNISEKK